MSTRGNGRVYSRPGSPFWWIAYYHNGKEQRETAKHVRKGEKLEAVEAKRYEAERWLRKRMGEVIAERHGGPGFVSPAQQRMTVCELLDALKADYELRSKWNDRTDS